MGGGEPVAMGSRTWKLTLERALATIASFVLAAPQFLMAGTILLDLRRSTGGMVAWAGLFSILLLGVGAMAFLMLVPAYYAEGSKRKKLRPRFFTVAAVQFYLYPFLHVISKVEHSARFVSLVDILIVGGGLALGTLLAILAKRASR